MASPPMEFLAGKITSLIENEVSLLAGVRDELEEIKRELLTMKAFLADSERKGVLSEMEKTWVENVRDVSIDVEDIIDDYTYKMNKQKSWGPYTRAFRQTICFPKTLWERRRIATKLQTIIKTIRAIRQRNQSYGVDRVQGIGTCHNYDPNWLKIYGESSLFFKDDDLVGINDAKEKLLGWLLSEQPQRTVISVVGMGGSGKTTLVANIYKSPTLQEHFDCYAWITVSQTYATEDLLRLMIKELFTAAMIAIPLDLSNVTYIHLVEMLLNYLQRKRYVIVLDDVWDIKFWGEITGAFPDEANGSRVMLTTRNEDIASFSYGVGCHVYHVQPLTDSEAWDLFSKKAFSSWPDSFCPPEFECIALDLVAKCKGLPLGVASLGALMSVKKTESEWRKVYKSLNWELSNNPTLEVVKKILMLSFNDLPHQLKHCFLYCSLFPEDYEIDRHRLIRLWIAEGFVEKVRGEKPEERANIYVKQLICRCMLQKTFGRGYILKMHDLLRELALSISETEKFCTTYKEQDETNEESTAPRRLSIQGNYGELRTHKDMSKVRTFIFFNPKMANINSSTMEKLPSGFKKLRVLDIEGAPLVQLPNEMVKLFNLKYLNLSGTKVNELPEGIGNLHNLETLDISNSNVWVLPIATAKLQKLRHLLMRHYNLGDYKLFHCAYGTQVSFRISKLKRLQVLCGMEVGGMVMKQLRHLDQLTDLALTNVREADEEDLCNAIESMKLLEYIEVKTRNEDEVLRLDSLPSAPPLLYKLCLIGKLEKVPHWFISLQTLRMLSLYWTRLTEDLLPHIQALPNLVSLALCHAFLGNQLVFHTGFRKLAHLSLVSFPQLNSIIIKRGVMPELETLRVDECLELKQLPHGIEHLTCLQKLFLFGVSDELHEQLRKEQGLNDSKVEHIPDIRYYTRAEWEKIYNFSR